MAVAPAIKSAVASSAWMSCPHGGGFAAVKAPTAIVKTTANRSPGRTNREYASEPGTLVCCVHDYESFGAG